MLSDAGDVPGRDLNSVLRNPLEPLRHHIVMIPELSDLFEVEVAHDLAEQDAQDLQLTR